MDNKALFNWGFWDAYHSEDEPQKAADPAYMAGFECGKQQRQNTHFDTTAQSVAFTAYHQNKS